MSILLDLTLPDALDLPTCFQRQLGGTCVALLVASHLGLPQACVRTCPGRLPTMSGAAMPEAPVNEDDQTSSRENDVGRAPLRQGSVKPESAAGGVQGTSEEHLRGCIRLASSGEMFALWRTHPLLGHGGDVTQLPR